MIKVECIAREDLKRQDWGHETVCIKKGQKFTAAHTKGTYYITVEGHGFKDNIEFIPINQVEIIGEVEK